jgi:hypothetical protein
LRADTRVTVWGMIDATLVTFPVVADELNTGIVVFTTTRSAAEACLPTDAFEVIDVDGAVDVYVTLFEYVRGDWAPCNSVDIAFPAKPAGAPDDQAGVYLCPTVVNQRFSSEAAYWTMGVSRSLAEVDVSHAEESVTFTVRERGLPASTLRLPRGRRPREKRPVATLAYTCVGTQPYVIPFEMDLPMSALDAGEVTVELGRGPLADTLRSLGWPAPVTFACWGEGLTGRFHAGEACG